MLAGHNPGNVNTLMLKIFKDQAFTLVLFAVVLLAFLLPEAGRSGGWLQTQWTGRLAAMLIFFLQGLSLPTRELARGLLHLRLHVFVQAWNFLLVPAVAWLFWLLFLRFFEPVLVSGFLYLAVLPTTISSAVALTTAAGGDVSAALFNTTLSNLLGVVLVPAWCFFLFAASAETLPPVLPLFGKVATLIALPLLLGQLLRPLVRERGWFARVRPRFKTVSNGCIAFIVFAAFSNSVVDDTWSRAGWHVLLEGFGGALLLLLVVASLVWWMSALWGLKGPGRVAGFYCASQKTLAAGVPLASAIFAGEAFVGLDLGLLLLPLLCYHPLQLILAGVLLPGLRTTAGR